MGVLIVDVSLVRPGHITADTHLERAYRHFGTRRPSVVDLGHCARPSARISDTRQGFYFYNESVSPSASGWKVIPSFSRAAWHIA